MTRRQSLVIKSKLNKADNEMKVSY